MSIPRIEREHPRTAGGREQSGARSSGPIHRLLPSIGCPPPESLAPDAFRDEMHALTRRAALEADGWGRADAVRIAEIFDARAESWDGGRGPEYLAPLADALARGAIADGGLCLEIGSGTGLQTPQLVAHFDRVVAVDLALEMLRRAPSRLAPRLQGDASSLPVADGSVDAVVCVNAFLFPAEYARVLVPGGVVVFVSTRGDATPIYLHRSDVVAALARLVPSIEATSSGYARSSWTVVRLAEPTPVRP